MDNLEYLLETNYLTNFLRDNIKVANLYLKLSQYASLTYNSARDVFFPRLDEFEAWNNYINTNIGDINYKNDHEFYLDNPQLYTFLIFTFTSIRLRLTASLSQDINIDVYNVYHDPTKEELFKNESSCTFFHGTDIKNWYSILCNGLRNYSDNNTYRVHGKAYGSGIYLTPSLSVAKHYSHGNIFAVFQVLGNAEEYKKNDNIYVCPDNSKILLRKILVLNDKVDLGEAYSNVNLSTTNSTKTNSTNSTNLSKRLLKEYELMIKNPPSFIASFSLENDNLNHWHIKLSFDDLDDPFSYELRENGFNGVDVDCYLNDYPLNPPFIHVVYPRFKREITSKGTIIGTGHVTSGGAFCAEFLTSSKWAPSTRMDSVLINLRYLIVSGGGHIDLKNNHPYTYQEAKDSFYRISRNYGWI